MPTSSTTSSVLSSSTRSALSYRSSTRLRAPFPTSSDYHTSPMSRKHRSRRRSDSLMLPFSTSSLSHATSTATSSTPTVSVSPKLSSIPDPCIATSKSAQSLSSKSQMPHDVFLHTSQNPSSPRPFFSRSASTSHISHPHFAHLRVRSRTSLRFALAPPAPTSTASSPVSSLPIVHPHLLHLLRLLFNPVLTRPCLSLYLSSFTPAANTLHSLLYLMSRHSLSNFSHNILVTAAVYPHSVHQLIANPNLSSKDSILLHFIRALSACPARVPAELRNAVSSTFTPDRVQHIAFISAVGSFYSTLISLLGLTSTSSDSSRSLLLAVDHSEISAPSTNYTPVTSSSRSPTTSRFVPFRLAQSVRHRLRTHVTELVRLRLSKHSTQHLQRNTWLSHLPTTRREQLDYVRRHMGFVPKYLRDLSSSVQRSVFIYMLRHILLADCVHGISAAVKNLACFILATSSENAALAADAAFLAHRYGADPKQLYACNDASYLRAIYAAIVHRQHSPSAAPSSSSSLSSRSTTSSASSSSTSTSSPSSLSSSPRSSLSLSSPTDLPRREDRCDDTNAIGSRTVRRRARCHTPAFDSIRLSHLSPTLSTVTTTDPSLKSKRPELLAVHTIQQEQLSNPQFSILDTSENELGDKHRQFEALLTKAGKSSTFMRRSGTIQPMREVRRVDFFSESWLDVPDDPVVPDVNGLNSMNDEDFSYVTRADGHTSRLRSCADFYSHHGSLCTDGIGFTLNDANCHPTGVPSDEVDSEELAELDEDAPDLLLFDEKELVVLLLAHDIAQARRHNWRLCEKFAGADMRPLVSQDMAMDMHRLFDASGIMEVMSVFACFEMLHRWTTCYDYRTEALDSVVRQFVKTGVGRQLGVAKVGQRYMCSEFSEGLRGDCRSLKLPRHAVVSPPQQYAHLRQMSV